MENDLLTEDEFITPANYNPWKSFAVFYCIAAAQTTVVLSIVRAQTGITNLPLILGAFSLVVTIVLFLTMFLHKKENLALPWRIKIAGLIVLDFVYTVTYFALSLLDYNSWIDTPRFYAMQAASTALSFSIIFTVCSIAIYIVQKSKQRNGKL